jgi:sugar phosphate permease
MFIGTNTAEWVNEHFSRRVTALFALGGSAVVLLMIGLVESRGVALAGFSVCSFLFQNLRLCSDATVQANAISGAGGREFALYDANHNLLFILGILIGLLSCMPSNARLILVVCSTLSAVTALAVIFMSRSDGEHVGTSSPNSTDPLTVARRLHG